MGQQARPHVWTEEERRARTLDAYRFLLSLGEPEPEETVIDFPEWEAVTEGEGEGGKG